MPMPGWFPFPPSRALHRLGGARGRKRRHRRLESDPGKGRRLPQLIEAHTLLEARQPRQSIEAETGLSPTTPQEEAEASGCRSRTRKRRRRSSSAGSPRGGRSTFGPPGGEQPIRSIESKSGRSLTSTPEVSGWSPTSTQEEVEACRLPRRSDWSPTSTGEEFEARRLPAQSDRSQAEAGAEAAASASTEKDGAASDSTATEAYVPNSPTPPVIGYGSSKEEIHEQLLSGDPAIVDAFEETEKYLNKSDCQIKLPDRSIRSLGLDHREFLLVRAHATKIILKAAKFVVSLSSYIDNKLLKQCSGFLIEWDEDNKNAMVLTSTHLICREAGLNEWLGENKYAPDAEVYVKLPNDRIKGQLVYYHKHYDFAMIRVAVGRPAELAHFGSEVNLAQSVYVLGRDESLNIQISNGRVQYEGPTIYERHHHMHMRAIVREFTLGGPVIDEGGDVMGMASLSANMGFIPCSVLCKCLHLWRVYECIPRIQLGMKFTPIIFLDLIYIEKISSEFNSESGLLVEEVAGGSAAEKLGMRYGDIIQSVNGEHVATTVELELVLLRMCEDNLVRGNELGSNVDVPIEAFYASKGRKDNTARIKLKVIMSDDVEVVEEGGDPSDIEYPGGAPSDTDTNASEVSDS